MEFTVKQLKAFVAVARYRSFAQASEEVHLSQPALSIAIKKLEDQLGGKLLHRTTRSIALTPEGEALLPVAQRLLQDWRSAYNDMHQRFSLQRGRLSLACMPSLAAAGFPAVIAQFHQQYPEIDISLEDIVMEDVVSAVAQGKIELGLAFEQQHSEQVIATRLFEDRAIVALPSQHPLAARKQISWKQLAQEPFITLNRRSGFRQIIDAAQQEADAVPDHIYEANQLMTVASMTAAGLGLSVVPGFCRERMQQMGLACKTLTGPVQKRWVCLYANNRLGLSSAAQAMQKVLQSYRW
jgi:LysR family carnitine catabolism transcriptional activator